MRDARRRLGAWRHREPRPRARRPRLRRRGAARRGDRRVERHARRHPARRGTSRSAERSGAPHVGDRRRRGARGGAPPRRRTGAGRASRSRCASSFRSPAARAGARPRPSRAPSPPTRCSVRRSTRPRSSSAVSLPRRQWRDGISTTSRLRCSAGSCSSDRSIPIDVVRLPIPDGLRVVLAHPSQRLRTSEARGVLPTSLPARRRAASDGAGRRDRRRVSIRTTSPCSVGRSTIGSPSPLVPLCCLDSSKRSV